MAKIDVTTIEGYDSMTPEQKIEALEKFEYEDHSAEARRYKEQVSKANGEAAEWKRKHNELLSEDERKKAEADDTLKAIREELDEYKRRDKVNGIKTKLIADGYTEELATESAAAFANGDIDKFFANQKVFLTAHDKEYKMKLMNDTPAPPPGEGSSTMTLDAFRKLSDAERFEYAQKNPEEYKKLYGGN